MAFSEQRNRGRRQRAEDRHISIPPIVNRAAAALAEQSGHGNLSRLLQDLVIREAIEQFGPDWAERFSSDEPKAA